MICGVLELLEYWTLQQANAEVEYLLPSIDYVPAREHHVYYINIINLLVPTKNKLGRECVSNQIHIHLDDATALANERKHYNSMLLVTLRFFYD